MLCLWDMASNWRATVDSWKHAVECKKKIVFLLVTIEFMSPDVILICSTCQSVRSLKPSTCPVGCRACESVRKNCYSLNERRTCGTMQGFTYKLKQNICSEYPEQANAAHISIRVDGRINRRSISGALMSNCAVNLNGWTRSMKFILFLSIFPRHESELISIKHIRRTNTLRSVSKILFCNLFVFLCVLCSVLIQTDFGFSPIYAHLRNWHDYFVMKRIHSTILGTPDEPEHTRWNKIILIIITIQSNA